MEQIFLTPEEKAEWGDFNVKYDWEEKPQSRKFLDLFLYAQNKAHLNQYESLLAAKEVNEEAKFGLCIRYSPFQVPRDRVVNVPINNPIAYTRKPSKIRKYVPISGYTNDQIIKAINESKRFDKAAEILSINPVTLYRWRKVNLPESILRKKA